MLAASASAVPIRAMSARAGARPRIVWPQVCILAVILVSTFQVRVRPAGESLNGTVDLQVLLEIGTYGAVGVFALSRVRLRHSPPHALVIIASLHFVIVGFSVLYSPAPAFGVVRMGQTLCVAALAAAMVQRDVRSAIHGAMHGIVVVGLVATALSVPSGYRAPGHPDRFTFWNLSPNNTAFFLALSLVITVSYVWDSRLRGELRWNRYTYRIIAVILAATLLWTEARAVLLATLAALVLIGWQLARRRSDATLISVLSLSLLALIGWSSIQSIAYRGQTAAEVASLNSRTGLWDHSLELIGQHPFLGHGYGASRQVFSSAEFTGVGGAHNALLEIAVDAGVPAAIMLACLVALCFRYSWAAARRGHPEGVLLIGLFTIMAGRGLAESGLGQLGTLTTLWLLILIIWLLVLTRSRPEKPVEDHV